jgi:hypothetical protein
VLAAGEVLAEAELLAAAVAPPELLHAESASATVASTTPATAGLLNRDINSPILDEETRSDSDSRPTAWGHRKVARAGLVVNRALDRVTESRLSGSAASRRALAPKGCRETTTRELAR